MIYVILTDLGDSDCVFFQAEDGIRDLVRSRGLGDVYKRQTVTGVADDDDAIGAARPRHAARRVRCAHLRDGEHLSLIHI